MHVNVDTLLVDKMVNEVKSQGVFDQFRKDSMADVDTKPAYQNLRQRVESTVGKFLADQTWRQDLNKNQLREKLRKHITEAGFLDTGVERIVDQVVNPKISAVFQPKIEAIAYKYLGIEKPHSSPPRPQSCNGQLDIKTDLLPNDLEAVSPDSDKTNPKSECKEDVFNDSTEDKNEEFESPPFEPIGPSPVKKEDSNHSHLSGISGLTSQDSVSSAHKENQPKFAVNADTQQESVLSEVSSNSRLSIVTNDESSSKPTVKESAEVDISEEAQMPKFNDSYNSNESKVVHNLHFDIKREDIKFEGTDRNADKHLYESDHSNENYSKTEIPLEELEKIEQSIERNVKSEFQIESEFSGVNIKIETEIKGEDASNDSISNQISSMFEEPNEYAAVDMSCSESDISQSSNSLQLRHNKNASDLKSGETPNGNIVPKPTSPPIAGYMPPKPPSPPNNEMFSKPPSPFDKVITVTATSSTKKDSYRRPPSPLNVDVSSNYPSFVSNYLSPIPPYPTIGYLPPRPPSSGSVCLPPRPPSPTGDYLPPRPPPPVSDYSSHRPPSPTTDYLAPRPLSPSAGDYLVPRPPPTNDYLAQRPSSPVRDYLPPRPPPITDYLPPRPPPKADYMAHRPPTPVRDYLDPRPSSDYLAARLPSHIRDYLAPRPPHTTDYLVSRPLSPVSDYSTPRPPSIIDYSATRPPSPVYDYLAPRPPATTEYLAPRPPSSAIDYSMPRTATIDAFVSRPPPPVTDYSPPRPPSYVSDYLLRRPPSPPPEDLYPRPPSPVSQIAVPKSPSPINQDLPSRPPSVPPHDYSYAKPASPLNSKCISYKKDTTESASSYNKNISKPSSPPPLATSNFMPVKDTSYSEAESSQSTNSSEHKNKPIPVSAKSDESKIWDILPPKPPSTPPLPKSNSKIDNRSKSSSYHHKSKSSRDGRSSNSGHSYRSSSSSSRNHSSPSSSHHRSDDKNRSNDKNRSEDKNRSNSSSRHKSSKSDKDKSREKKKDDHTSARHKERRRKSTDSNDGDNHKQTSRHSSHHGDEKSRSLKESTSNSNSSGNFSSNTNSNSGTSCNDSSQKKSKSERSYNRSKESSRSSPRDESLKYFVIDAVQKQLTETLLVNLEQAIYEKQLPIYLLDCENDTKEMFENASRKVVEVHITHEYDPTKSVIEKRKSKIVKKNDKLKNPEPMQISSMEIVPMPAVENTPADQNALKTNLACTISRKRKRDDSYTVSYHMFTGNDKELIIDCLEYNKTKKIFRPTEDHIEVSPASSELSVSSKENEFAGMAKKPSSLNTKNGKHIRADEMEKIEKTPTNGFKASSQRYSSEDLYKPRPLSQRPRRREMMVDSSVI